MRRKLAEKGAILGSPVFKESVATPQAQTALSQQLCKEVQSTASLLSFDGASVVEDDCFRASDQGIQVGAEVLLSEATASVQAGTQVLVLRVDSDGVLCSAPGVADHFKVLARVLSVIPPKEKVKPVKPDSSTAMPVDLPAGLVYTLETPRMHKDMLRALVQVALQRFSYDCNPSCDVLHLVQSPHQVVVARPIRAGELVLAPFNQVISCVLPADVALSGDFVKLTAVEKVGRESFSTDLYVEAMGSVDSDSSDSSTARCCVCPFWFIRDVVVDGDSQVVYSKSTEDTIDVGCSVKGKDVAKRVRMSVAAKVTIPLYTNESDLPVATRLAVPAV